MAAFCATDVRAVGAGTKAAADPAKREIRASFIVTTFLRDDTVKERHKAAGQQHAPSLEVNLSS
jgi:hypothetical protein